VNTPSPLKLVIFRNAPGGDEEEGNSLPSEYALERSRAERSAADQASSERAREIHRQLAASYARIARRR
jgi:hypothetical protein